MLLLKLYALYLLGPFPDALQPFLLILPTALLRQYSLHFTDAHAEAQRIYETGQRSYCWKMASQAVTILCLQNGSGQWFQGAENSMFPMCFFWTWLSRESNVINYIIEAEMVIAHQLFCIFFHFLPLSLAVRLRPGDSFWPKIWKQNDTHYFQAEAVTSWGASFLFSLFCAEMSLEMTW